MKNLALNIGRSLEMKRKQCGLSKSRAAKQFGLGRNFLRDAEAGKATSQIEKVLIYADKLNLEVSMYDRDDPASVLEGSIKILLKSSPESAYKLINSLSDEEKLKINIPQVKNRVKSNIKRIALSF